MIIIPILLLPLVASVYINKQVICNIDNNSDINSVQLISIDSYPSNKIYNKYIRREIIPIDGIEQRYCNEHVDNTMAGALGIRANGIPSISGIVVRFIPSLNCIGNGYEPFLISAIDHAINISISNSEKCIRTVVIYSISGSYNTREKIEKIQKLTNVPGTYVVAALGNNIEQYNNCENTLFKGAPKLIIVGGTNINGNNLLANGMVGNCARYYAPGNYKYNGKNIIGTSFAAPIVANLIIRYILKNPTRNDPLFDLDEKSDIIYRLSKRNENITMRVFRNNGICK